LGHDSTVIATGGLAPFVTPLCRHTILLEPDLLLRGLNALYKRNKTAEPGV
jgi:type III pantothenate kinase